MTHRVFEKYAMLTADILDIPRPTVAEVEAAAINIRKDIPEAPEMENQND